MAHLIPHLIYLAGHEHLSKNSGLMTALASVEKTPNPLKPPLKVLMLTCCGPIQCDRLIKFVDTQILHARTYLPRSSATTTVEELTLRPSSMKSSTLPATQMTNTSLM